MDFIGAGLRYDVDDAGGGPAKFRGGAGCYYLELFDRIERNVDGSSLSAQLLAEKSVVVITAVQADVVEDAALSGKRDFISIRTLDDADAGG